MMTMSLRQEEVPQGTKTDVPLKGIRTNIVQSIRAFRVQELQDAAVALGQHFLYANLANAQTKQDVLDMIGQQFMLPMHVGKNFDALYDSMTDPVHKSGPQPGFIVVLEHVPTNIKFDKEAREQLLDIFRDTADYWGDRKIPFRCFYSFP
jgi:RNAse (barnase) inhibitor barstar